MGHEITLPGPDYGARNKYLEREQNEKKRSRIKAILYPKPEPKADCAIVFSQDQRVLILEQYGKLTFAIQKMPGDEDYPKQLAVEFVSLEVIVEQSIFNQEGLDAAKITKDFVDRVNIIYNNAVGDMHHFHKMIKALEDKCSHVLFLERESKKKNDKRK